ncbi:hypothetical protein C8J56DRAFT_919646 [Mycena floridula]|nr:hypothetical protein C8J56DRAFT_919646 [Mycena floridula]
MSASTVARWNAIPMVPEPVNNLKRPRPESEEDDDMALVSRSPSPSNGMDMDVDKYDEYLSAPAREVVTVETKIKPSNKGFALLAKLGWSEGQPLGLSGEGRVDPIPFQMKADSLGLGRANDELRRIETTVSQRRFLDSERQKKETDEQRAARLDASKRRSALEHEISDTLRSFYCNLCDKQFQNVAQYDEHTNSYAHHHKARFRDMQANIRIQPQEEIEKRKEKERRREEKELRKIAAANGVKMPKPAQVAALETDAEVEKSTGPLSEPPASVDAAMSPPEPPAATVLAPVPPTTIAPLPPPSQSQPPSKAQASRAGWQNFQKSNSRRK